MKACAEYERIERAFGDDEPSGSKEALSAERREALRRYWLDRAEGELTTALSFEFVLQDLEEIGAPAALRALAAQAIADEHNHVDWCLRLARTYGADEATLPRLAGTRPLCFDGASVRDNRLLRTIFGSCFSETVALHVLLASQRRITNESLRLLNHRHIKEEVQHARLGWALLAWPELSSRDRSMIAAHVPFMTRLTRDLWLATPRPADPELHQLGFLSSELVEEACTEAFREVIQPGLEHHGIPA